MALSNVKIKSLKPKQRRYSLSDSHGLRIEVMPSGTKSWRLEYRLSGKHSVFSLGRFPSVSLASARGRRDALLPGIRAGKSPTHQSQIEQQYKTRKATLKDFGNKYLEFLQRFRKDVAPMRRYLERDVYPLIGERSLGNIEADDLRELIFARRDAGKEQSALAIRNLLKRLWDYALICGVTKVNPLHAIPAKFVAQVNSRSRALDANEITLFLRSLNAAKIRNDLKLALRLILLTLTRKSELRLARWKYINLARGEWEIPQENSKTDAAQIVYLSAQAVEILRHLDRHGGEDYLFPARNSRRTPMSASTLNRALSQVKVKVKHFTVHDLRRTAATNLSEQQFSSDWIEKALNHKIKGVRGVYNRAQYATQRREMLQSWADWIDSLLASQGKR